MMTDQGQWSQVTEKKYFSEQFEEDKGICHTLELKLVSQSLFSIGLVLSSTLLTSGRLFKKSALFRGLWDIYG